MDRLGLTVENCTDPEAPHTYGCPPRNYMTRYLCGHGAPCADPPDEASFELAAQHLIHIYAFVGVLEEARPSLAVLQRMFPGYFPNPLGTYGKVNPTNRNAKRKYASFLPDGVRERVRRANEYDWRLYAMARGARGAEGGRLLRHLRRGVEPGVFSLTFSPLFVPVAALLHRRVLACRREPAPPPMKVRRPARRFLPMLASLVASAHA